MDDEKIHLIFGASVCMYLICFIFMLINWIEAGCIDSFITVIISAFIADIIVIVLISSTVGFFIMLIKLFFD